jgi:hypothetical protein
MDDIIVVAKARKDQDDAPGFAMVIAMMALSVALVMVRAQGHRKRG